MPTTPKKTSTASTSDKTAGHLSFHTETSPTLAGAQGISGDYWAAHLRGPFAARSSQFASRSTWSTGPWHAYVQTRTDRSWTSILQPRGWNTNIGPSWTFKNLNNAKEWIQNIQMNQKMAYFQVQRLPYTPWQSCSPAAKSSPKLFRRSLVQNHKAQTGPRFTMLTVSVNMTWWVILRCIIWPYSMLVTLGIGKTGISRSN